MRIRTPFLGFTGALPYLKGEGILVRLAKPDDEEALTNYFVNNREFHRPFDPTRSETYFNREGWKQRLKQLHHLHRYDLAYYFLIFQEDESEVSGVISYSNLVRYPLHACTLGYSLDERKQGLGLMRSALRLTNDWLFKEQNMHRIMANYMPHNKRSAKVLAALNFEIEGCAKNYLLINGQWQDHVLSSLTNAQWRKKTNKE